MSEQRIIAITAQNAEGLAAPIGAHFGRCPYYTFVTVDDRNEVVQVDSIENPFFRSHQPGAVPSFLHERGADVVLSGGMGARAVTLFNQYGIDVATGISGTAGDALNDFLSGQVQGSSPCAHGRDGDGPTHGGHGQGHGNCH